MEYFQLFFPRGFPFPSSLICFCLKAGTCLFNKVAGPIINLLIRLQYNGGFCSKHEIGTKNTKFQTFSDRILVSDCEGLEHPIFGKIFVKNHYSLD